MTRASAKQTSIVDRVSIGYANITQLNRQKKNKLIDKIYDRKNDTKISIMGGSTANITVNLKQLGQSPKFIGAVVAI